MPGRPKQTNNRQNRAGTADECLARISDAIQYAHEVEYALDTLIEGQGSKWGEVATKLQALYDHALNLAV